MARRLKLLILTELFSLEWSVEIMKPCTLKARVDNRGFSVVKVRSNNNIKRLQKKIPKFMVTKKEYK